MSKPILLLNCGSSSIKYQMIDAESDEVMATGLIEKIGVAGDGTATHNRGAEKYTLQRQFRDHTDGLAAMAQQFAEHGPALESAIAVGHRTVHGGSKFNKTTVITDEMLEILRELSPLAPLHNPAVILGIKAARQALPDIPHVAVFDTAFFSSLPPEAYRYAIDRELAERYSIRKYGFHGTSHSFVSKKAAEFVGKDYGEINQIVAHLGNGASVSAVAKGKAVEASMGLTPLAGLVMGTRSGDVDPGLHAYLMRSAHMSIDEIDSLLNKQSGMLALGGASDFRDLRTMIEAGDAHAQEAFDVYIHRLISYIGAFMAVLGRVDVLTFTAGVGENDADVRQAVVTRLHDLGFHLDAQANAVRSKQARAISTPDSPVTVLVVPTNEELAMAWEAMAAIS